MAVSSGSLDGLLNTSYSDADFTGVSTKSWTGIAPTLTGVGLISSVTLTTTGGPAPTTTSQETLKVVAVNDPVNSVTLSFSLNGQPIVQSTEFVIGFSSQGLLLSGDNANVAAGLFSLGEFNFFDDFAGVLSSAPIAAETNITFTDTGSYTPGPTTPTPTPGLAVLDNTTAQTVAAVAQPYTGPVAGLLNDYINITPDNLNISASTPSWFIHSGSGTDAIAVSSGTNVLDGGTGSNFLTGGSGTDTFFVDDRGPTADLWSTVVGFHSGDAATVWGVTPQDFGLAWADGQGAAGYTGVTLHATAAGKPTASLTLVGFTQADMAPGGRLSVSYGTDSASGSAYMYISAV